ncbi:MAG TPA: TonB-dependent receptor [Candidatus Limnocylindrales bacterium]|nr:TonB-dependent receptor [Candidatus Limnocylindrales bacterium]
MPARVAARNNIEPCLLRGAGNLATSALQRKKRRAAPSHNWARVTLCVALLIALPWPSSAFAQDADQDTQSQLKTLSLEQLGDVRVTTVSKEPQQVWKTPAAVYVITQEDIRRSGATSLPEVLRLAPGVEVAQIDGNQWSVAIRGFSGQFSRSLLVLVDGRSVYTPLFAGVYWDLPYVMLEDVERIEVIRGPGGTIWGSNAVNGVINIITKNSKDTHGGLATAGGGNVDYGTGAARWGGSTAKGFNYRIYEMGFDQGPGYHSDGNNFDPWRFGQIGFRTDWQKGKKDTFTVQGDLYSGESGEDTYIATFSPPAEITAKSYGYSTGGNIITRWQHTSSENSDFQIQASFDRTNRQDAEVGETRDTFDVDYVQRLRVGGRHELTWGLGARISPSNVIQSSQGVNFLPNSQTDSVYSGFAQDEISIVQDKLIATVGTKLEHNNFSGFEYQPSVRLLWALTDHQSFWTAVTRAVRTPSRLDQDVQFAILIQAAPPPPVFFDILGNPDLHAETLLGYEAGYRTEIRDNLYVSATGFYNVYNDLQGYGAPYVAEADTPPPPHLFFVIPYANAIQGHTIGAEIAPTWKVTHWWQLRGSYSFLHMSLRDKDGFTDVGSILGSYTGSSPSHVGGFQSFFNLPGHFEFDQSFRYSSALPAQVVSSYSTMDARIGWRPAEHIELSFVGQNLLQPFHAEYGGDPGPLIGIRRSYYGKITFR